MVLADEQYMQRALSLAADAAALGEVPVGAVIVDAAGAVIGEGSNAPISQCDPCAHAEIIALRAAGQYCDNYRLPGATLYVTIEPCTMCFGAMLHARLARVCFGAPEPKHGALVSALQLAEADCFNHQLTVTAGVLAGQCQQQIQDFFKQRRQS